MSFELTENAKTSLDFQIEKYEKILQENPEDLSALMAFAEANLRRGWRLAAMTAYHKITQVKPENVEVHIALAKIYIHQKLFNEACEELKKVFELEPHNVEANIICQEMLQDGIVPEEWADTMRDYINHQLREEDIDTYLCQLQLEKEKLEDDVAELQELLDQNPLDTILEYNKYMTIRRKDALCKLISRVERVKIGLTVKAEQEKEVALKIPEEEEEAIPTEEVLMEELVMVSEEKEEVEKEVEEAIVEEPEEEVLLKKQLTPEQMEKLLVMMKESLDSILQSFKRTKGVLAVFVMDINATIFHSIMNIEIDLAVLVDSLISGYRLFKKILKEKMNYWVLEYAEGLLVFQTLDEELFLVAIGDRTANFGALRYGMDRNKLTILEAVSAVFRDIKES